MAKNDFKAFATDRNANVISQEEWEALPALLSGFTAGKASSAQVNKVIRQASFIAAALAQFVSDKTQRDVLDNGDLPGFVELLGSGFAVEYLSRKNPFGDIKSDGTVETALENLGLGEGSALPVGVGCPDTGSIIAHPFYPLQAGALCSPVSSPYSYPPYRHSTLCTRTPCSCI
ncbi:Fels-2 prophage Pin [Salmonella enterica subsp. enterica serovar Typhi]|nr:Fels-2 prophage Pin [Salmonella enterica subsp. enterica serovar Typhi]